ncbi:MAG: right-handed parallel beta-helix repeat-containing protein [Candidatus Bathyarchaeota archaeon]|nr:right-handed parallel beta-helix repeat-containing protein [Candidatus Bathyarchaeota archaeon]
MKRFASKLVLSLFICSLLLAIPNIQIVKTQPPYEPVTIRADGTIDPATAPIQRFGDVYTLTGDMDNIRVERNNMILDGNGHTLTGKGRTMAVYVGSRYVTIKNLIINGGHMGISLASSSSNVTISGNVITGVTVPVPELQATGGICVWGEDSHVISGNHIENNYIGIYLYESSNSNIYGNNITNNKYGLIFWEASNNIIYRNRLTNNTVQIYDVGVYSPDRASPSVNKWDNGTTGNYWSDYNGTDNNRDGIGDTPYVIYESNQDIYPLMSYWGHPTIFMLYPQNKTYSVDDVSLTFIVSEPTSWIGYSLDGQANVTITGNTTLSGLSYGSHNLIVYANDTDGNTGTSETIIFTIAQKEPFLTTWIVAAVVIIAVVGAALLVYFRKIRKKAGKAE